VLDLLRGLALRMQHRGPCPDVENVPNLLQAQLVQESLRTGQLQAEMAAPLRGPVACRAPV